MKIKNRKTRELKPATYNPRYLTTKQEEELLESLKKFGIVSPIIVNINPERKDIVVGGHQRLKLWSKLGKKTIPCIEVNLTEQEERELNVRLNKNGGEFDISLLKQEFKQEELQYYGFEAFEIGLDEFVLEGESVEHEKPIEVEKSEEEDDMETITVTVSESDTLIYICIDISTDRSLGWEEMQEIKDAYHPNLSFVEVYPSNGEVINKANNRHLFHVKGGFVPHLSIIEQEMETKHFIYNSNMF